MQDSALSLTGIAIQVVTGQVRQQSTETFGITDDRLVQQVRVVMETTLVYHAHTLQLTQPTSVLCSAKKANFHVLYGPPCGLYC